MSKRTPLSKFESLAQGLVEGSLGRLLGGGVTPADIAAHLGRVAEDSCLNGQVADAYRIRLHPADLEALLDTFPDLESELENVLLTLVHQSDLTIAAYPEVKLFADTAVKRHEIRIQATRQARNETTQLQPIDAVSAELREAIATLDAYLVVDGRHHIPLDKPILTIGRRTDNHIVLDAATVSRRHAQLRWRYGHFVLYDLSRRDGRTQVNGQSVNECVLQAGDIITLSNVKLLYAEGKTVPRRGTGSRLEETQIQPRSEPTEKE